MPHFKHKPMKRSLFLPRFFALWLTLCLGLPNPAYALRNLTPAQSGVEQELIRELRPSSDDRSTVAAGAEEEGGMYLYLTPTMSQGRLIGKQTPYMFELREVPADILADADILNAGRIVVTNVPTVDLNGYAAFEILGRKRPTAVRYDTERPIHLAVEIDITGRRITAYEEITGKEVWPIPAEIRHFVWTNVNVFSVEGSPYAFFTMHLADVNNKYQTSKRYNAGGSLKLLVYTDARTKEPLMAYDQETGDIVYQGFDFSDSFAAGAEEKAAKISTLASTETYTYGAVYLEAGKALIPPGGVEIRREVLRSYQKRFGQVSGGVPLLIHGYRTVQQGLEPFFGTLRLSETGGLLQVYAGSGFVPGRMKLEEGKWTLIQTTEARSGRNNYYQTIGTERGYQVTQPEPSFLFGIHFQANADSVIILPARDIYHTFPSPIYLAEGDLQNLQTVDRETAAGAEQEFQFQERHRPRLDWLRQRILQRTGADPFDSNQAGLLFSGDNKIWIDEEGIRIRAFAIGDAARRTTSITVRIQKPAIGLQGSEDEEAWTLVQVVGLQGLAGLPEMKVLKLAIHSRPRSEDPLLLDWLQATDKREAAAIVPSLLALTAILTEGQEAPNPAAGMEQGMIKAATWAGVILGALALFIGTSQPLREVDPLKVGRPAAPAKKAEPRLPVNPPMVPQVIVEKAAPVPQDIAPVPQPGLIPLEQKLIPLELEWKKVETPPLPGVVIWSQMTVERLDDPVRMRLLEEGMETYAKLAEGITEFSMLTDFLKDLTNSKEISKEVKGKKVTHHLSILTEMLRGHVGVNPSKAALLRQAIEQAFRRTGSDRDPAARWAWTVWAEHIPALEQLSRDARKGVPTEKILQGLIELDGRIQQPPPGQEWTSEALRAVASKVLSDVTNRLKTDAGKKGASPDWKTVASHLGKMEKQSSHRHSLWRNGDYAQLSSVVFEQHVVANLSALREQILRKKTISPTERDQFKALLLSGMALSESSSYGVSEKAKTAFRKTTAELLEIAYPSTRARFGTGIQGGQTSIAEELAGVFLSGNLDRPFGYYLSQYQIWEGEWRALPDNRKLTLERVEETRKGVEELKQISTSLGLSFGQNISREMRDELDRYSFSVFKSGMEEQTYDPAAGAEEEKGVTPLEMAGLLLILNERAIPKLLEKAASARWDDLRNIAKPLWIERKYAEKIGISVERMEHVLDQLPGVLVGKNEDINKLPLEELHNRLLFAGGAAVILQGLWKRKAIPPHSTGTSVAATLMVKMERQTDPLAMRVIEAGAVSPDLQGKIVKRLVNAVQLDQPAAGAEEKTEAAGEAILRYLQDPEIEKMLLSFESLRMDPAEILFLNTYFSKLSEGALRELGLKVGRAQLVPPVVYGNPPRYAPSQLSAPVISIYVDERMNNAGWVQQIRDNLERQIKQDPSGRFRLVDKSEARSAAVVVSDHDARIRPGQVLIDVLTEPAVGTVLLGLMAHMDGQGFLAVEGGVIYLYKGDQGEDVALFV